MSSSESRTEALRKMRTPFARLLANREWLPMKFRNISEEQCELELLAINQLNVGDFYELLPPENDIHSVKTTSQVTSVSLHLLGRDIGCVWRHSYDPEHGTVRPFRSGYTNAPCEEGAARQPGGASNVKSG